MNSEVPFFLMVYNATPAVLVATVTVSVAAVRLLRWWQFDRRPLLLFRVVGWLGMTLIYIWLQWQPAWWQLYGRALFRFFFWSLAIIELAATIDGWRRDRLVQVVLKAAGNG